MITKSQGSRDPTEHTLTVIYRLIERENNAISSRINQILYPACWQLQMFKTLSLWFQKYRLWNLEDLSSSPSSTTCQLSDPVWHATVSLGVTFFIFKILMTLSDPWCCCDDSTTLLLLFFIIGLCWLMFEPVILGIYRMKCPSPK